MSETSLWQGARRLLPSSAPDSAVILLHGLGSNADDLIGLAPYLQPSLPRTAFVSPNAPEACDMGPYGRQWFSLQSWTPESLWHGVQKAAPALMQMIEDVKADYNLPTSRVALLGFSQGTMMSLHVAPRLPEALAAVVGLSGALVGEAFLTTETRARPPVLLVHGEMDDVVPVQAMQAAAAALQRNNFAVDTLTRPRMAHNVDDVTIERAAAFLTRHLCEG